MPIAAKVAAILETLSPADITVLSPAERRRLADQCRHVASIAEPASQLSGYARDEVPSAGVLSALREGQRWE